MKRRALPLDKARDRADAAASTTVSRTVTPSTLSCAAFRLIAAATARCIATGREERVETILDAPLAEVQATLRAGLSLDEQSLDVVVDQALLLCEITHSQRWIDYVHEIFDLLHRPIPLAVLDRLMPVVERKHE